MINQLFTWSKRITDEAFEKIWCLGLVCHQQQGLHDAMGKHFYSGAFYTHNQWAQRHFDLSTRLLVKMKLHMQYWVTAIHATLHF